jgi:hypothetical protein
MFCLTIDGFFRFSSQSLFERVGIKIKKENKK